jgi:hypothetical protein
MRAIDDGGSDSGTEDGGRDALPMDAAGGP